MTNNYNPWDNIDVKIENVDYSNSIFLNFINNKSIGEINDSYPRWVSYELGITNPIEKHKELIELGYLQPMQKKDILQLLNTIELKQILNQYNLSNVGRKEKLLNLILENIDASTLDLPIYYVLTNDGKEFLNQHKEFIELHDYQRKYNITFHEYLSVKAFTPSYLSLSDIAWRIFQERYNNYFKSKDWGLLRNTELDRAELLYSEGILKDALYHFILVAYYDLSGCENSDSIKKLKDSIVAPAIKEKIQELCGYYEDTMIEKCYSNYLPHYYYDEGKFKKIILSIIGNKG